MNMMSNRRRDDAEMNSWTPKPNRKPSCRTQLGFGVVSISLSSLFYEAGEAILYGRKVIRGVYPMDKMVAPATSKPRSVPKIQESTALQYVLASLDIVAAHRVGFIRYRLSELIDNPERSGTFVSDDSWTFSGPQFQRPRLTEAIVLKITGTSEGWRHFAATAAKPGCNESVVETGRCNRPMSQLKAAGHFWSSSVWSGPAGIPGGSHRAVKQSWA